MHGATQTPITGPRPAVARRARAARARRADLRDAVLALERGLRRPTDGTVALWSHRVHDALIDLASTFERHIAVAEGDDGVLAEIADHCPRLVNAIARLCAEHDRIRAQLAATLTDVRRLPAHADADRVDALRDDLATLVDDLARHRRHGADVVWEAHAVDIGGWE